MLGNFTGDEAIVNLPGWEEGQVLIGSPGFTLSPWEGKAYLRSA